MGQEIHGARAATATVGLPYDPIEWERRVVAARARREAALASRPPAADAGFRTSPPARPAPRLAAPAAPVSTAPDPLILITAHLHANPVTAAAAAAGLALALSVAWWGIGPGPLGTPVTGLVAAPPAVPAAAPAGLRAPEASRLEMPGAPERRAAPHPDPAADPTPPGPTAGPSPTPRPAAWQPAGGGVPASRARQASADAFTLRGFAPAAAFLTPPPPPPSPAGVDPARIRSLVATALAQ